MPSGRGKGGPDPMRMNADELAAHRARRSAGRQANTGIGKSEGGFGGRSQRDLPTTPRQSANLTNIPNLHGRGAANMQPPRRPLLTGEQQRRLIGSENYRKLEKAKMSGTYRPGDLPRLIGEANANRLSRAQSRAAKGGGGRGQPRHPKGTSEGGQWK